MPPCEGGYKEFRLGDLFDITTSKSVDKNGLIPTENTNDAVQFIGRTQVNNGLQGYTRRLFFNPNPAQTFSIIQVGDSVMQYRESEWYASQNIFLLKPRSSRLVDTKLYIIGATNKALMIFNGGYNIYPTLDKLKDLLITLPTTSTGEIDFQFMESRIRELEEERMRELEEERMRELEAYLTAAGFANCDLTPEEQGALRKFSNGEVIFKNCRIDNLFEIKKGTRLTKADMVKGSTNFIGATATNNGITASISNIGHIHPAGLITVSYNGSVGEAFYQTKGFWASDDINVLYPKFNMNESLALFFLCPLKKKGKAYGYAYKWKKEIMEKDSINLPVTSADKIDYNFMETYISAIKKQIIQQLKDFIAKEHTTYQQIMNQ